MDFNLEDLSVFDALFKKRPEISPDNLKHDLKRYYLPYIQKLINLKQQEHETEGMVVGVSAIQGAGKTTQGEILQILLDHLGHSTVSLSIDDHYITHEELNALRQKDPRFIRRGVTHNIPLAIRELSQLKKMEGGTPVLIAGYDKGAHNGDGDRFAWIIPEKDLVLKVKADGEFLHLSSAAYQNNPLSLPSNMGSDIPLDENLLPRELATFLKNHDENEVSVSLKDEEDVIFYSGAEITISKKDLPKGWRLVSKKPDFIFYDGWMLGARKVEDESVFETGLPALKTPEDIQFAKDINKKLFDYEALWQMIEFMTVLYVENYEVSIKWRDQAEEALRAKGEGMTTEEIVEFVHYFWRSVHPAIQIKNLTHDKIHTQQVVTINDDHSIGEIRTP